MPDVLPTGVLDLNRGFFISLLRYISTQIHLYSDTSLLREEKIDQRAQGLGLSPALSLPPTSGINVLP
jgi:hypothetical protein